MIRHASHLVGKCRPTLASSFLVYLYLYNTVFLRVPFVGFHKVDLFYTCTLKYLYGNTQYVVIMTPDTAIGLCATEAYSDNVHK